MLKLYKTIMSASAPVLRLVLKKRCRKGKEDADRLEERMGVPSKDRPEGTVIWFHAASVGEAQSTLILIEALLKEAPDVSVLVTTGTVTSAQIMKKRLPDQAFHQYYPLDHPGWVESFLNHWQPDLVLWLESEIWPNMLMGLQDRSIPAALINARVSDKTYQRWRKAKKSIKTLLSTFRLVVAQNAGEKERFERLGADNVIIGDNLKYAAAPLPCKDRELKNLEKNLHNRQIWVFASTHANEEDMAARIHLHLRKKIDGLLTIIVPRHPERRQDIVKACSKYDVKLRLRSKDHTPPQEDDDLYIADTLGELGLFYRLAPIACIGRSLSADGGGGHNPIEAAQLNCAVLHGPLIQNLAEIYREMDDAGACLKVSDEKDLQARLEKLFTDEEGCTAMQNRALKFTRNKSQVLQTIFSAILPWLEAARQTADEDSQNPDKHNKKCA